MYGYFSILREISIGKYNTYDMKNQNTLHIALSHSIFPIIILTFYQCEMQQKVIIEKI